jgi:hypothetical protein
MAKYAMTTIAITKDGHTMFRDDIVNDLNRKSHLESLTLKQQQEIADQKRKLEDKVRLIKFTDKANSEMALEIAELKAMVNVLRESLDISIGAIPIAGDSDYQDKIRFALLDTLDLTPAQCLASVKADVVEDALEESLTRVAHSSNVTVHQSCQRVAFIRDFANKLREQK